MAKRKRIVETQAPVALYAWRFSRAKQCTTPSGRTDGHLAYLQMEWSGPPRRRGLLAGPPLSEHRIPGGMTALCAFCGLPSYARVAPFVVAADRFFDARAVAFAEFHTTEIVWEVLSGDVVAEAVVGWDGSDAGRIPTRQMQVTRGAIPIKAVA